MGKYRGMEAEEEFLMEWTHLTFDTEILNIIWSLSAAAFLLLLLLFVVETSGVHFDRDKT